MPRQTGVLIGIGTVALIGLGCTLGVGLINLSTWLNQPSPPAPPTFSPVGDRLPILLPQPLSQTIRGYTATIVPIYADANHITLSYSLAGPDRAYPYEVVVGAEDVPDPHLTGPDGARLAWRRRGDMAYTGDIMPVDYISTTARLVYHPDTLNFDGPSGAATATMLALHLELPLQINDATWWPATPTPRIPFTAMPLPKPESFNLPFSFDFTVPFDPRRRETVGGQTAHASGVIVTLERVIVTASETRLILHYAGDGSPTASWDGTLAIGRLVPGGGAVPISHPKGGGLSMKMCDFAGNCPCDSTGRCTFTYTDTSLLNQPPAWSLRIDTLAYNRPPTMHSSPEYYNDGVTGPWIIAFTVPPLASPTVTP